MYSKVIQLYIYSFSDSFCYRLLGPCYLPILYVVVCICYCLGFLSPSPDGESSVDSACDTYILRQLESTKQCKISLGDLQIWVFNFFFFFKEIHGLLFIYLFFYL